MTSRVRAAAAVVALALAYLGVASSPGFVIDRIGSAPSTLGSPEASNVHLSSRQAGRQALTAERRDPAGTGVSGPPAALPSADPVAVYFEFRRSVSLSPPARPSSAPTRAAHQPRAPPFLHA